MSEKTFKWAGPATFTRSTANSAGTALEPDHHYEVERFGEAVVAEWVKTGFAEYSVINRGNDTTIDVKSVVVKTKTPKIGE